jgi:hypothetical protein
MHPVSIKSFPSLGSTVYALPLALGNLSEVHPFRPSLVYWLPPVQCYNLSNFLVLSQSHILSLYLSLPNADVEFKAVRPIAYLIQMQVL